MLGLWAATVAIAPIAHAQEIDPPTISILEPSPVCSDGSVTEEACITLPPIAILDKVDVFFLFDDTGSFAGLAPSVITIFSSLVNDLETALPGVEFGFGVGRFEDYGGPGNGFSGEVVSGRPFILNQPIVTALDAGTAAARDALINAALAREAPGFGGDGPETDVAEGLYQVATGLGFDGDGNGLTTVIGGAQVAGAIASQNAPDASGDVPAFSTLAGTVVSSGTVGGVGFRTGSLRLVILATDICSVAAFDAGMGVPPMIVGTGGMVPTADFACTSLTPGIERFGFVSDSKTFAGNTIPGAVVPAGAGTVPATIAALNAAGIRILGMAPFGGPVPAGSGPSTSPSVFLSALARLTGAVDDTGNPLVFDIGGGGTPLKNAIVEAITETTTLPVDITLVSGGTVPAGLSVDAVPDVVPSVPPGGEACFDVTFTGTGSPNGSFELQFKESASSAVLGAIPVDVGCQECNDDADCNDGNTCTADTCNVDNGSCSHERANEGLPCDGDMGVCLDGQCVDVPMPARADLEVLTACRPVPPCPDGTVSCDIHVFNHGPSPVANVVVDMELTGDLLPVLPLDPLKVFGPSGDMIGMGPAPSVMGQQIEWTVSNVPAGGKAATWFTLNVGDTGGMKTVSARGDIPDPDPTDNSDTDTITPNADLCPPDDFAQKAVDPEGTVCFDDSLFYVTVFQHPGAATADVIDELDPCLDPSTVSALMPPACMLSGTTITCDDLALDAGGRGQFSFAAKPTLGCAAGTAGAVITNQAQVTFDDDVQLATNTTANRLSCIQPECDGRHRLRRRQRMYGRHLQLRRVRPQPRRRGIDRATMTPACAWTACASRHRCRRRPISRSSPSAGRSRPVPAER